MGNKIKTEADYKRARIAVGDAVSAHLGNNRATALKSYIDPAVWGRAYRKWGLK